MTNQYSIEIHDYVSEKTTFRSYRIASENLTWITGNKSGKVITVCRKNPIKPFLREVKQWVPLLVKKDSK